MKNCLGDVFQQVLNKDFYLFREIDILKILDDEQDTAAIRRGKVGKRFEI